MSLSAFGRLLVFWLLVGAAMLGLNQITPYANVPKILATFADITAGDLSGVSDASFAFALSSLIVQFAAALALTFLITHVFWLRLSLWRVRSLVSRTKDARAFAAQFARISDALRKNRHIGSAYEEFAETTVESDGVIQNTLRPQTFINFGEVRERLFGLKMMHAIPGYFVGLGLLLTFIGLVIALNEAVEGFHQSQQATGDATQMTEALGKLLMAATFKFSTSIAGLGASLALSVVFRAYQIWIDEAFYHFCLALERRMSFHPSQRLAIETRDILAAQRDELKEINSDRFFARFGESMAPGLQSAIEPLAASLKASLEKVEQSSQGRVEEMLERFLERLNAGAGAELNGVADRLRDARDGLADIQGILAGSGSEFAGRLSGAAEQLVNVVNQAGRAADAFGHVATNVETATRPLLAHGEQMAKATSTMSDAVGSAVTALGDTGAATRAVAQALETHFGQIESVWKAYEERFGRVDEDFGRAAERFHEEVSRHQDAIRDFVAQIDAHTASVLAKLSGSVTGLHEDVGDLAEAVGELKETLRPLALTANEREPAE
jgi:hypothetical protein